MWDLAHVLSKFHPGMPEADIVFSDPIQYMLNCPAVKPADPPERAVVALRHT